MLFYIHQKADFSTGFDTSPAENLLTLQLSTICRQQTEKSENQQNRL